MWSSIEQIIKPESLNEALILQKHSGSILFTGGSYLVSQKSEKIHTLVDINHLLSDTLVNQEGAMEIGSGCTLQDILNLADRHLTQAISASCPSKNIRNQRTIGGEIAQARPDSDLLVYLHAAEARVELNESNKFIPIAKWDGSGIISKLHIPQSDTRFERVAVLDSATAYVIVAVHQTAQNITVAIGGKMTKIISCKSSLSPEEDQIRTFMEQVESAFSDDHFGSPAYKRQLVSNLLTELTVVS